MKQDHCPRRATTIPGGHADMEEDPPEQAAKLENLTEMALATKDPGSYSALALMQRMIKWRYPIRPYSYTQPIAASSHNAEQAVFGNREDADEQSINIATENPVYLSNGTIKWRKQPTRLYIYQNDLIFPVRITYEEDV